MTQTLFPLVRRRDAEAVLERFVPGLAGSLEPLQPAPPRARRSFLAVPLGTAVAASALIAAFVPGAWPAIGVLLAGGALLGELRHAAAGWLVDGDRVVLRSRTVARTTLVADRRRLQERETRQTVLQRRRDLADLGVAVGSRHRARVRHLEAATAHRLLGALRS